jgi:hypothetical protein
MPSSAGEHQNLGFDIFDNDGSDMSVCSDSVAIADRNISGDASVESESNQLHDSTGMPSSAGEQQNLYFDRFDDDNDGSNVSVYSDSVAVSHNLSGDMYHVVGNDTDDVLDPVDDVGLNFTENDNDDYSDYNSETAACSSDSDTDSDSGLSDEGRNNLSTELAEWGSQFQIKHNALGHLLTILKPYHPNLPKDARTLLNTKCSYDIRDVAGGQYYHFGIARGIGEICNLANVVDADTSISLQLNIDGLPIFKSSKTQFWPILGRIVEPTLSEVFIIGLFSGEGKPGNVEEYLKEFVNEVNFIETNGIVIEGTETKPSLSISCFICDAPARAFIKQVKGHNAYHGCEKCIQTGVWVNKVTFPERDAPLRTDIAFNEMTDAPHHIAPSPLRNIVGLVSQVPLYPMHLVHLGVMKRLIWN